MSFFQSVFGQRKPRLEKIELTKHYDLLSPVGQGSMSQVWRARDSSTGRIVAVKVLDVEKTARLDRFYKQQDLEKPTEGEIAIGLNHPNIVRTLRQGLTTNDEQFLVMEFLEGVGLSFLIDMQNQVMRENRLRLMIELGEAIAHLHSQKYLHRDICPRNVMLDGEQRAKLIDFGVTIPNTSAFREATHRVGTPKYLAPEQLRAGQAIDERVDIFSYALTCYEMVTQRHPWDTDAGDSVDDAAARLRTPAKPLREHVPDCDEALAEVIMRGLAIRPDNRWPTMTEMVTKLRDR